VHPERETHNAVGSRKVFAGNFRNFRKRYANQGFGVDPLGETAKLRTVSRAEFLQGVSASFRRFAPLRAIVGKAPISQGFEVSALSALSAGRLLSRPGGRLQQIGIDGAARAEFPGAADVLGLQRGGRP
jgi:hypothetical protein